MPYIAAQTAFTHGCGFPSIAMTRKDREGFPTRKGEEKKADNKFMKLVLQCHIKPETQYQMSRENAGTEITKQHSSEDKLPPTPSSQCQE